MAARRHNSRSGRRPAAAVLALAMLQGGVGAAQTEAEPAQQSPTEKSGPVTLDRVVAIVNGDLILESDLETDQRFTAFQPFSEARPMTREGLIDRQIDRTLILQQMALQPEPPITDAEVDAELAVLRKSIPRCSAYHCETEAGWEKFVADQGFTMEQLRDRWRQRMEILRFIEERFRMGIRIEPSEVDDYYKTTMLPVYQKEGAAPPPEANIADRIQEILLQQRVNKLLDDWLTALRAQGGVTILKPGEEAP